MTRLLIDTRNFKWKQRKSDMTYPPPITDTEKKILEIIARGHPSRVMYAHFSMGSSQISPLERSEIQIAVTISFDELNNCIAHLVANGLIENGIRYPGFFGTLASKKKQTYFWATDAGYRFLQNATEIDDKNGNVADNSKDQFFIESSKKENLTADQIDDAVRIYENSFSANSYCKDEEIVWATSVLEEDIKSEIAISALEIENMWCTFEKMFGYRGAVKTKEAAAVRDPVIKRATVRIYRAKDEQLSRLNFPPSEKPESWVEHYESGNIGLPPAPWE